MTNHSKQTNKHKQKQPSSVGREKASRGLSVATHAVGHHFSNSKKTTKNKKRKKITFFILYLRYFVLCILILWVFGF
ncbi:hypothetical protein ACRRTK_006311 [Alexandromys fortis]